MTTLTYLSRAGDTVDSIAFLAYGATAGITEAILEANPGLSDHGPILPNGVEISLPEIQTSTSDKVTLWS